MDLYQLTDNKCYKIIIFYEVSVRTYCDFTDRSAHVWLLVCWVCEPAQICVCQQVSQVGSQDRQRDIRPEGG